MSAKALPFASQMDDLLIPVLRFSGGKKSLIATLRDNSAPLNLWSHSLRPGVRVGSPAGYNACLGSAHVPLAGGPDV